MVIELKEPGREPERRQDKVTSMLCPMCKVALTMSDRQGVEIDYCPQCRGVWLDRGELDKIIERSAAEATAQRDRRDDDEDGRYGGHGGGPGGHGGHGGGRYGGRGHRRRSWLADLFD